MNNSFALVVLLLIVEANAIYRKDEAPEKHEKSYKKKPNIVLILTDDQDVELGSMSFMPHTLKRIRDEGAEMRHAYSTSPVCCPSRSSLLSGLYIHNHGVYTNSGNCTSLQWRREQEPYAFPVYLDKAGYRTGYFGKYLNLYDGSYIPPGWKVWGGQLGNAKYYNYSVNFDGKLTKHGFDYGKDYYPDLIANDSLNFLRQSREQYPHEPIMLVASFPSPHSPEISAPQYSKLFFNVTTHHTPAYDFAPNPDKQWILQVTKKMKTIEKQFGDLLMMKRLQTLQSVDHAVERIYQELKNSGELDNTYFMYTSDHGYHIGQFGLIKGKGFPFEPDIRVPFYIRGPRITPGSVVNEIVLNIDMAPTFLDIAGVAAPPRMDGRSFKRLLSKAKEDEKGNSSWRDSFLIMSPGWSQESAQSATKKIHTKPDVASLDSNEDTKTNERQSRKERWTITENIEFKDDCFQPEMICTQQNNFTWPTPPFWDRQPFCSCLNADNNTYTCIREINEIRDILYCEFGTEMKSFYNLRMDPFQLSNEFASLPADEKSYLHYQLQNFTRCKGAEECTLNEISVFK